MKIIDVETWSRKAPYQCFIKYDHPIFSLSVRMDVTRLVKLTKQRKTSFFTDFLYIVARSLNKIEDFRIRIKDGKVVVFDKIDPSYIVLSDDGVIVTKRSEMTDEYRVFYERVRSDVAAARQNSVGLKFNQTDDNDLFYVSCLPWSDFLSMSNPYDFSDQEASSVPRITWGKYTEQFGKYELTLDISAHHALMDGYQMSQGFLEIQNALQNVDQILV